MEEEIPTIDEDAIVSGVASLNGQTGDLNLKTVNGESVIGDGDIEIRSGVSSVNGQTGDVNITASDLGAASASDLQDLQTTVAGKQDKLSIAQMNAVNSGIDSTKVAQIATNAQGITNEANARQSADINLQSQIDGLAASSDVTDIVGTKAQLNDYDTSKLKDNDIVKVLQDESQSGETTYYRWSTITQTFTLIGEEGPYYTKSEADVLLNGKVDTVTGYGLSENNFSDEDLAKLGGIEAGAQVNVQANWNETDTDSDAYIQNKPSIPTVNNATLTITQNGVSAGTFGANASSDVTIPLTDTTYSNFVGTDGTAAGSVGLVPAPATTDAGKFLKADGTWDTAGGGGGSVETGIGTSETNPISQLGTTKMIYPKTTNSTLEDRYIGIGKDVVCNGFDGIAIGYNAKNYQNYTICIGRDAKTSADYSVAIGYYAGGNNYSRLGVCVGSNATIGQGVSYSVALGAYAKATVSGEVNIGTGTETVGYNSSNYRLLSGVYDGQGSHDAATKGQLDNAIINGGTIAPTTATVGSVGTLYSCVESGTAHLYSCTDVSGSTYTWSQLI